MPAPLTFQEQFLLLCLNDQTGKFEEGWVDYGINGAALAELLLRGRIGLDEKRRVVVEDASPVGDELLDRALARLAESKRSHGPDRWVGDLYRGRPAARQLLIGRLTDRGLLTTQEGRFLWIFPQTRYPAQDTELENRVRERLRQAALSDGAADQPTTIMLSLLRACDALDRILTRAEIKERKQHLESLSESDPVAQAVGKAVTNAIVAWTARAAAS